MRDFDRWLLVMVLLFCCATGTYAQEKKWEHNFYVSVGEFIETGTIEDEKHNVNGITTRLGYGLNYYFSESFSVMPGLALHDDIEKPFKDWDDKNYDHFNFLDVPVVAQYHIAAGIGKLMFGFGPVFSFSIYNDTYDTAEGWVPNHPLKGKTKIKTFNFSVMPCVAYETKRMRFVLDGSLGLLDVQKKYGKLDGTKYLHNVCMTVGVKI